MDKKAAQLINQQINKEFYSAYLYLDFSNYLYDEGLSGFGNWFRIQAQEEQAHAMLFLQYLQNNGVKPELDAVEKPAVAVKSVKAVLDETLKHEKYVTSLIDAIYEAAHKAKDYRSMQFLDWFIKEQGEEETNADDMVKKMKLFGTDAKGLYALNQELAARVYTPSATGPAM